MGRDLSRARAILIGNGNFTHLDIDDLPAGECVAAMADLLTEDVCGWPVDRIVRIEDAAYQGELASQVRDAIKDVQDILLVYYVGHGFRTSEGKLALALRETDPAADLLPSTAILFETFADLLRGCSAATKLVVLDCCHAELGNKATHIFNGANTSIAEDYSVAGLYFICASKWNERARTPVDGGLTYFTRVLIDVVREGIPGLEADLRLEQIFIELRKRLLKSKLPEPVESGVRGAHRYPFASNAAYYQVTAKQSRSSPESQLIRHVQEKYRRIIHEAAAQTGREPGWSEDDLGRICDALGPGASRLHDTVIALRDATEAKRVFASLGGNGIRVNRLRFLYELGVGRLPSGPSSDAMLVEAASAAVAERKKRNPLDLTALARFILMIARELGCGLKHPALLEWISSTGHSPADAEAYLSQEDARPAWLLITCTGMWPTEVTATLQADDQIATVTRECHPSRDGLAEVLRGILSDVLPPLAVVDLEMPRELFHQGVERWPLIRSYGPDESLSDRCHPRLRWSGRRRDVEALWRRRASTANWAAKPIQIEAAADDPDCKAIVRQLREEPRVPYLIGRQSSEGVGLDPLLAALFEGCGFILWFPADAEGDVFTNVTLRARRVPIQGRRHLLPDSVADLAPVPPALIWDDPAGRAGYTMPRAAVQGP